MSKVVILYIFFSFSCFASQAIKNDIEKEFKIKVRDYATFDFGRDKNHSAISFMVAENLSKFTLVKVRALIPKGYLAYIGTTRDLSDEQTKGHEVVVIHSDDKFDILRTAQSNGLNFNLTTKLVIDKLQKWDELYDIDIWQAETDTIQLKLKTLPKNITRLSHEIYKFCPDIVDQGSGDINDISSYLKDSKQIYLWWD